MNLQRKQFFNTVISVWKSNYFFSEAIIKMVSPTGAVALYLSRCKLCLAKFLLGIGHFFIEAIHNFFLFSIISIRGLFFLTFFDQLLETSPFIYGSNKTDYDGMDIAYRMWVGFVLESYEI